MKIFKQVSISLLVLSLFVVPVFIYAQDNTAPTIVRIGISNPFNCGEVECTLPSLITAVLNKIVMPIAAVAVVIWIIWAGFTYLMANGKPAEIQKAHERLLWALVGAGILLGAAGISAVVQRTIEAVIQ